MENSQPFSIWQGQRSADYYFHDEAIQEYFYITGLGTLVYRYTGPVDQGNTGDATTSNKTGTTNELTVQDWLYLENRDKTWDLEPYDLHGLYEPQDADYDLKQFGLFLDNDNIYIKYHYNDMIRKLGRKIMVDDIIEFPNLRDYNPLDENTPSLPKLYVVTDALRDSTGFSPTWHYHVWRVKCKPMVDSQEYNQFLSKEDEQTGFDLKSIISTYQVSLNGNDLVTEESLNQVPMRGFETRQFYIVPGDEGNQYPWIFAGDGLPPNGAVLAATGTSFPQDSPVGSYFLHTGFEPNILYKKEADRWAIEEYNYRLQKTSAHRILTSFINNNNITSLDTPYTEPTAVFNEKENLSKVLVHKGDFNNQLTDNKTYGVDSTNEIVTTDKKVRKKKKPTIDKPQ